MKISDKGLLAIKKRECFLDKEGNPICNLKAYAATKEEASEGKYTIAYGNTFYADGSKVKKDDEISKDKAEKVFKSVVAWYESKLTPMLANINLNQSQYDAIISFVYNIGISNFANSTFLKLLHQNNLTSAGNQFHLWVYQKGKVLPALVTRRISERNQFFKPE